MAVQHRFASGIIKQRCEAEPIQSDNGWRDEQSQAGLMQLKPHAKDAKDAKDGGRDIVYRTPHRSVRVDWPSEADLPLRPWRTLGEASQFSTTWSELRGRRGPSGRHYSHNRRLNPFQRLPFVWFAI